MVKESYIYKNNPLLIKDMNDFLIELNMDNKSEKTITDYESGLRMFLDFLKNNNLIKYDKRNDKNFLTKIITITDLQEYITFYFQKGNAPCSLNKKKAIFVSFYDYLIDKEIVEINLGRKLKSKKLAQKAREYLTIEQSKNLINAVKNSNTKFKIRDLCIFTVLLNNGLRISELTDLDIDEIDLKTGFLKVIQGKGDKDRVTPLNEYTEKTLNDYFNERNELLKRVLEEKDKSALFLSQQGKRLNGNTINKALKKYLPLAGLDPEKVHLHTLRHSYASAHIKNGTSIQKLQKMMGHTDPKTTMIYAHMKNEELKEVENNSPICD